MLVLIALLLILVLWLLWALQPIIAPGILLLIKQKLGYDFGWTLEQTGPWGDTFGALNTLFAAFGFIAVLTTLRQQQAQIKAAQDEQHRQRFESSYFELLRLLREARKDLRFNFTTDFVHSHVGVSAAE